MMKIVDRESFAYKLATNRIGLWLFLISDLFIFGGLMISRINLLGLTRPDLIQVPGPGSNHHFAHLVVFRQPG